MSTVETKSPNFSKMGTPAIEKAIETGKFVGADLTKAREVLTARKAKPAPAAKKEVAKKEPAKKAAAKKEAAPKKVKEPKAKKAVEGNSGISLFLRKLMTPKDGTKVCGVTYGEANKKVQEKFPTRIKLYPSEFDRNFKLLEKEGVINAKQPARFKTEKTEKAAKAVKAVAKKK